jgi:hypothetical protein
MAKHIDILKAIRARDWTTASVQVAKIMEQKVSQRLAMEKNDVATTLLVPRLAEGFRRGEKVVLAKASGAYTSTRPNGQRTRVTVGSIGEYVRQINAQWSVVWFPEFYDSTEVRTSDLVSTSLNLYDEKINEDAIEVGDRIRTKKMGQTPGTVVKVENGNVHFELDEPAGKFGKRVWVAPLSNVQRESFDKDYPNRKDHRAPYYKSGEKALRSNRPGGDPDSWEAQNRQHSTRKREASAKDKEVNEDSVSQHEVQRIYNEVGDIGETELLCGISSLRVNPQGQVISYICEGHYTESQMTKAWNYASSLKNSDKEGVEACGPDCGCRKCVVTEATSDPFPRSWKRGWMRPYKIAGGGTERPFLKDGHWYLLVYNQETGKREVYSFYDDVFVPEKEFYKS